jgi:hypothetical protein
MRRERTVLNHRESASYEIVVYCLVTAWVLWFFEYLKNCWFLKKNSAVVFKFTFSNIFRVVYSSGCSFVFFSVECVI